MKTLNDHIEITPGVRSGKPRIAGHRITVSDVAVWHEQQGMSVAAICEDFKLTKADVHAALAYYFDNRAEIDAEIQKSEELAQEAKRNFPSILAEKLGANQNGE